MKTLCLVKQLVISVYESGKVALSFVKLCTLELFLDDKAEDSGKQNSLRRGDDTALQVLQRNA